MTVAERDRFLDHLDQDAARLDRLVRRLLDLARADVMPATPTARAEVAAVIERLAARYQAAEFKVVVAEPAISASVAMPEDVLESILSNLLDNARQHGGDAVTVTVACPAPRPESPALSLIHI